MELFEQAEAFDKPLAARMRPQTLEELVGQEHIVGSGRLLNRAIRADQLSSLIFYGPPGTGKTSLARVIANSTRSHFITINAVLAGVKDIRAAVDEAQRRRSLHDQRSILFVDEVHRWNKAQQDALLPWVENGTIVLIGATIENPYFEVNRALVSRSRIFQLKPLSDDDLYAIARRALGDPIHGFGKYTVSVAENALTHLVQVANGDARSLLNALELAVTTTPSRFPPPDDEPICISLAVAEDSIQRRVVLYDKEGDYHFDTISAFIKSLRGSDPDAALYWLAKMVYAGEDPRFIFRRMLIFASEDVGLADPQALVVAEAAAAAFDRVGLPEGRFHLAHAALYLATAEKSNSVMGFFDALDLVTQERDQDVPTHLKDSSRDKQGFGHGQGYLYPHAYRDHWIAQQYLPDQLQGKIFYQPGHTGQEQEIRLQVERRREVQLAAVHELQHPGAEVLTFCSSSRHRDTWFARTMSGASENLAALREHALSPLPLKRHSTVINLRAGDGLFVWELLRRCPEGGVWALVEGTQEAQTLRRKAEALPEIERPTIIAGQCSEVTEALARQGCAQVAFDAAVGRNVLFHCADKSECLNQIASLLSGGGMLSLAEATPSQSTRLADLVDLTSFGEEFARQFRNAEESMHGNFDTVDACEKLGLTVIDSSTQQYTTQRRITAADVQRWFPPDSAPTASYAQKLSRVLGADGIQQVEILFRKRFEKDRVVPWRAAVSFVVAQKGEPAP